MPVIRATLLVPPTVCSSGVTQLPTPPADTVWKVGAALWFNPGGTQAEAHLLWGLTVATQIAIWSEEAIGADNSIRVPLEDLVIRAGDTWAMDVSLLDVVTVTFAGYQLRA